MDSLERDVHVERYYPSVLAPALEFKELARVTNIELNVIWGVLWKWFRNKFVYEIDVDGAERWEKMLDIHPLETATLEERRQAILFKINDRQPYTIRRFQQILDGVFGENNVIADDRQAEYTLYLTIDNGVVMQVNKLRTITRSTIPANLLIKIIEEFPVSLEIGVGGLATIVDPFSVDAANDFSFENVPQNELFFGGCVLDINILPLIKTESFKFDDTLNIGLYGAGAVVATSLFENIRTEALNFDNVPTSSVYGAGTVGGIAMVNGVESRPLEYLQINTSYSFLGGTADIVSEMTLKTEALNIENSPVVKASNSTAKTQY